MSNKLSAKEEGMEDYVCHLDKSLYGMPTSPRYAQKTLVEAMKIAGLSPLKSDPMTLLLLRQLRSSKKKWSCGRNSSTSSSITNLAQCWEWRPSTTRKIVLFLSPKKTTPQT